MASGSGKGKRTSIKGQTVAKTRRGQKRSAKVTVNSKGYVVPGSFPF